MCYLLLRIRFSPHECHLQVCSVNVLTSPVNQVKSLRSQRAGLLPNPTMQMLYGNSVSKSQKEEPNTKQQSSHTPLPKLVFRQQPASSFQRPLSLWSFLKCNQVYLKLHIKSQWVFVTQLVSSMPIFICTSSFFFFYDSCKWCPTQHRSNTRKRGLSVRRNTCQLVKQGPSVGKNRIRSISSLPTVLWKYYLVSHNIWV